MGLWKISALGLIKTGDWQRRESDFRLGPSIYSAVVGGGKETSQSSFFREPARPQVWQPVVVIARCQDDTGKYQTFAGDVMTTFPVMFDNRGSNGWL